MIERDGEVERERGMGKSKERDEKIRRANENLREIRKNIEREEKLGKLKQMREMRKLREERIEREELIKRE